MVLSVEVTVTLIVYTSLFLNFFLVASFDCLGPSLAEKHGISKESLSLIISVKSMVNMAMGPTMAILSPSLPPVVIYTIGGVALGSGYLCLSFSNSFGLFVIYRALLGVGTAGLMVGGMSVLMRYVPKNRRGRYTSIAYSAAGHAPLIAPLVSGVMYDRMGQFWTYIIPCLLMYSVCGFSFIILSRLMPSEKSDSMAGTHNSSSVSSPHLTRSYSIKRSDMWPCIRMMLSNPMSFIAFGSAFCDGFSFGSCETTLPQLLTDWDGGLPVMQISLIYSIGPLTFSIFAPIAGYLVDKYSHYKIILFGLLIYATLFPFFDLLVSVSLAGLAASIAIAFLAPAFVEVALYPLVASVAEDTNIPNAETFGYACNELCLQGGYAIGNLAGRQLINWNGLTAVTAVVSGLDFSTVIVSLILLKYFMQIPAERSINVNVGSSGGIGEMCSSPPIDAASIPRPSPIQPNVV